MRTKINKRGNKFAWSEHFKKWVYEGKVAQAVIMTPSLTEIFKIFGENILRIEARGSKQEEELVANLEELGCEIHQEKTNRAIIRYRNDYQTVMKDDDLDKINIKRILYVLSQYNIKDCAVTYLKIKLEDKELKEVIEQLSGVKIDTKNFIVEFRSGKCEEEIVETWEGLNEDLTGFGFKKTVLNCVKLIDETSQTIFRKDYEGRWIINWETDIDEIISPKEVCKIIVKKIGVFGKWKSYKKTSEDKLVLDKIY